MEKEGPDYKGGAHRWSTPARGENISFYRQGDFTDLVRRPSSDEYRRRQGG